MRESDYPGIVSYPATAPSFILAHSRVFSYGDDDAVKAFFRHEAAHVFEAQDANANPKDWEPLPKLFDAISKAGSKGALFALFDESSYFPIPQEMGHPNDSPSELFASTSAILITRPKMFLAKLAALPKPAQDIALEVARFVVSRYLRQKNCPKNLFSGELLSALRLQKKATLAK